MKLLLAIVCGIVALVALVPDMQSYATHVHARGYAGQRVPQLEFVDQTGRPGSIDALHGHPFVLAFFCTRCTQAKICDDVSGKLAYLQARLPADIRFIDVTFDPETDATPQRKAYAQRFGALPGRWLIVSGNDADETESYAAQFGVFDRTAGRSHADALMLVDSTGRVVEKSSTAAPWHFERLIRDVQIVDGAHASFADAFWLDVDRLEDFAPNAWRLFYATPAMLYFLVLIVLFARAAADHDRGSQKSRSALRNATDHSGASTLAAESARAVADGDETCRPAVSRKSLPT